MTHSDLRERVARAIYGRCRKDFADDPATMSIGEDFADAVFPPWEETNQEPYFADADAAIALVLEEAAAFTKAQAQAFRDDAHNRKQFGDSMMHKRGLAVAAYFDQHAAAIRALKEKT